MSLDLLLKMYLVYYTKTKGQQEFWSGKCLSLIRCKYELAESSMNIMEKKGFKNVFICLIHTCNLHKHHGGAFKVYSNNQKLECSLEIYE